MSECFRNGGDVLRFGILTVSRPESLSAGRRAALRLRPGKGIRYGEGLFRTALFVTAFVEQWTSTKEHRPALLGVGATVLCLVLFGQEIFLIPSMAVITLMLAALRPKLEEGAAHE